MPSKLKLRGKIKINTLFNWYKGRPLVDPIKKLNVSLDILHYLQNVISRVRQKLSLYIYKV